MAKKDYDIEEYREVNLNMRHFSNMRVAVLTILLAANGAAFQAIGNQEELWVRFGIGTLGIISTLVFYVFENRVTAYYLHFQARAKVLEKKLGMRQYTSPFKSPRINATLIIKFLYLVLFLFWISFFVFSISKKIFDFEIIFH
ncbi:hypothetical protein PBT90_02410 [Algoriphagus halophytocola]|uniref:hypothetical protein n=1 Tax=Algoriphagus halophytocola TaxID=2991499 RepID=UPI0022DDE5E8|nr:hypothetical protein [Algoriphagus sp. TR-M9]WBL43544.1 hypothetical protein PBT90_02410 [Algoriphagus sp. TR-M9]